MGERRGQKKRRLNFYSWHAVTRRGIRVTRCGPGCCPVPRPQQPSTPEGHLPSATRTRLRLPPSSTASSWAVDKPEARAARRQRAPDSLDSGSSAAGAGPRSRAEGPTAVVATPGPLAARRQWPHAAASAPGGGGAARARRLSQHSQRRGESLPDVGGGRSGSGSRRRTMALVGCRGPVPRRPRAASLSRLTSREELPCD